MQEKFKQTNVPGSIGSALYTKMPYLNQVVEAQPIIKNAIDANKFADKVKAAFDEVNYMDLHAPNGMAFRDYVSAIGEEPKSSEIYKSLSKESSPQKASELFLKHGIKGIRYLDQRSREKGDGTYNFVIFDPSVIQIVSKNGEFVMSSKTPENVEV